MVTDAQNLIPECRSLGWAKPEPGLQLKGHSQLVRVLCARKMGLLTQPQRQIEDMLSWAYARRASIASQILAAMLTPSNRSSS